jgi:hypothetical protein
MFCLNREERDPERDQEGWALFAAMMFCGGSASVGGMLGFVAGMIGGTRLALKAAVTKGLLGALIAAALGFVAGFLVLLATDFAKGDWAELVLASGLAAFYSGLVGFITGTIVGTCQAARNQSKEKLSTG